LEGNEASFDDPRPNPEREFRKYEAALQQKKEQKLQIEKEIEELEPKVEIARKKYRNWLLAELESSDAPEEMEENEGSDDEYGWADP
jgi:phage shock protein A